MPANLVKTRADETKWNKAKKIVRKEYGHTEGKWPVVTHIFENMKKHASAGFEKRSEQIFWDSFNDEIDKIAGTQMYLGKKVLSILRDPAKAKSALQVVENAAKAKSAGTLKSILKAGPARRRAAAKGFVGTKIEDIIRQRLA